MIKLLLPCGFDTLKYSWVKATIGIYMLEDYFVAKKHQQPGRPRDGEPVMAATRPGAGYDVRHGATVWQALRRRWWWIEVVERAVVVEKSDLGFGDRGQGDVKIGKEHVDVFVPVQYVPCPTFVIFW
jgi:hypothetical protein